MDMVPILGLLDLTQAHQYDVTIYNKTILCHLLTFSLLENIFSPRVLSWPTEVDTNQFIATG